MRRWAQGVLRWRAGIVVLVVLLCGLALWRIVVDTEVESSLGAVHAGVDARQKTLAQFKKTFDQGDRWLVVVEGDIFDPAVLVELDALNRALKALELEGSESGEKKKKAFGQVFSILDAHRIRFVSGMPVVERYFDGVGDGSAPSAAEIRRIRAKVLRDPRLVGRVIDAAGRHTVIVLQAAVRSARDGDRLYTALRRILEHHRSENLSLFPVGESVVVVAFNRLLMRDTPLLIGLTVLLLIGLTLLLFRSFIAVVAPLVVVLVSAVTTFGLMAVLGFPVTTVTTIIPILLFCVGLGGSVHLISAFRDLRRQGTELREAVVQAVALTGVPIFFTGMTTMVGLLSFRLAAITLIRDFGVTAALAVGACMLYTLVLTPIVLSFAPKKTFAAPRKKRLDRWKTVLNGLLRLSGVDRRHKTRWAVLLGAVGLLVAAVFGVSRLRLGYDPLRRVPEKLSLHDGFRIMDRHLGGTNTLSLFVEGASVQTLRDPRVVGKLADLEAHIARYRDPRRGKIFGPTTGYLDLLRSVHQALAGGVPSAYRLPTEADGRQSVFAVLDASPPPVQAPYFGPARKKTRITFRVKHIDAFGYEALDAHIRKGIAKHIDDLDGVRVRPTGSVYLDMIISNRVTRDLLHSFFWAFVVITLLMVFVLRSIKIGILAMLPNILPIALVMGVMGFASIHGDIDTILIGSVALGIVVDDTIHLLYQFRVAYKYHEDVDSALAFAMQTSGRAIMATSMIIVCGFLVLLASSLSNVRMFGLLIALIAALALVIDLVVTPTLAGLLHRKRPQRSA